MLRIDFMSFFRIPACMLAIVALPLTAAAGAPGNLNQKLQSESADYVRTVQEGTQAGAVVGAAVGAVVGNAVNHGALGGLAGGLIGMAAGGLVGQAIGTDVANRKQAYAAQEDQLDDAIARAKAGNAKLSSIIALTTRIVATRQAELKALKQAPSEPDRQAFVTGIQGDIASLDSALAAARQTRDTLKANLANYAGPDAAALSSEAARTSSQVSKLNAQRNELARMGTSI